MTSHLRTFFTHKHSLAIGMVFMTMGFLFGNWATMIPWVKETYQLNDAQLGLLLLSMPLGSTIMNPITTLIINKLGANKTTIYGWFLMIVLYALPICVNHVALVSISLILVGFSLATTNVAMNTVTTTIENHEKINIMSTCHGMFSLGLMLGSIISSTLIGINMNASKHAILVSVAIIGIALFISPIIKTIHADDESQDKVVEDKKETNFTFPKGALLTMIFISLCTNMTEGTMADWTAVYMRDIVKTNDAFIGWGLAGYSMFMALGRFTGDSLIPKFGANNVLKIGGIIAACGILLAVFFPYTITAIMGFALVGVGVSCGAPILYGSAARVPNMAKGAGLATMNTFSMVGFLVGPVIIGFISKATSLPLAIGLVASLALIWAFLSGKVKLY